MLMPIPQPKPADKAREFGAAGACPAGGSVSEPTHSITLWEKQPRRAGMERAGGGKKTKTETELGRRRSLFFIQVRQASEEECFPLNPPGPEPRIHPQPEPGGSGGSPPLFGALQTCLPHPAAAAKAGDCVPRNLAAAHPMISSHSRQISLYLPAKWARGASSDGDCAQSRELGAPGMPQAGPTMALSHGFRGSCEPTEAELFEFTAWAKTKILPGAVIRGSDCQKIPSSLRPHDLDVRTSSPARTQVKEREPFSEASWGRCWPQICGPKALSARWVGSLQQHQNMLWRKDSLLLNLELEKITFL